MISSPACDLTMLQQMNADGGGVAFPEGNIDTIKD